MHQPGEPEEMDEYDPESQGVDGSDPLENETDPGVEAPSKSQLKRDAHALLDMGKEIVGLGETELATIPLDSTLRDAITHARKITSNSARKRQLHYIGKLLRKADPDPIRQALEDLRRSANEETRTFHLLESWRDKLIDNERDGMTEFFAEYPNADRQKLRQLLRNVRTEREKNKPPKAYRELFKWLRGQVSEKNGTGEA